MGDGGLSSLPPSGLAPNEDWPVGITVLQHGQTPLSGVMKKLVAFVATVKSPIVAV